MNWESLAIDFLFFLFLMGTGWAIGYQTGKLDERDRNEMAADLNRVKLAQSQQLYDWKRDGI